MHEQDAVVHFSLIGLPGSGKSTIGRQLARQWHLPFIDSDHVIEQRLGCTIKQYFAEHGEAAFRDVEQQVLAELLAATAPCVLSTGGGSVLRAANRQALQAHSTVFYLQSTPEDIARRLRNDTTRPLMQGTIRCSACRSCWRCASRCTWRPPTTWWMRRGKTPARSAARLACRPSWQAC